MKISVSVALEQELLARVDAEAGRGGRSRWVSAVVEKALANGTGVSSDGVAGSSPVPPASSRSWASVPGLTTGRAVADGDYEREPFDD